MEIVAVDGARLTILMIAGGIFSVAGILLMFRTKQEGSSARLELFGQKFEASSIGIVVFLIGAAFLATPLFVPERPSATATTGSQLPPRESSVVESPAQGTTSLLPKAADTKESEKNDSISTATIVRVGQTAHGQLRKGDIDWYAVAVDSNGETLHVVFRKAVVEGCPRFAILDASEKVVSDLQVCDISGTVDQPIESDRYFIRVDSRGYSVDYELALTYTNVAGTGG